MSKDLYNNGKYQKNNPDWHDSDAEWKAKKILNILDKNKLSPKSVCDIGCGTGRILKIISEALNVQVGLGIDISKEAINKAKRGDCKNVVFKTGELPKSKYELALAIDLIEHLEDYFSFLRSLKSVARYKVIHIPLSISVLGLSRKNYYINDKRRVGHLHPLSRDLILGILQDEGYKIIDYKYTAPGIERFGNTFSRLVRKMIFGINKELAAKTLGGFSLIILAE